MLDLCLFAEYVLEVVRGGKAEARRFWQGLEERRIQRGYHVVTSSSSTYHTIREGVVTSNDDSGWWFQSTGVAVYPFMWIEGKEGKRRRRGKRPIEREIVFVIVWRDGGEVS